MIMWICCDLLENWNWDTWVGNEANEEEDWEEEDYTIEEENQPNCEDPDFIVRCFLIIEAQMQQWTAIF